MAEIKLFNDWLDLLRDEFDAPYMRTLKQFLQSERQAGKAIFPRASKWFAALNATSCAQTRVVILGQDPYPTPGHAHGLSFSVKPDVAPAKSLQNIFIELKNDLGVDNGRNGYLMPWAEQGVLLLNAVLTVESRQSNSHQNKGWETFTDEIISILNQQKSGLVFILWGAYAQKKGSIIDRSKHHVIQSPHPSPLSAHRGFFGSKPFSRTNNFLTQQGQTPINWRTGN